MLTKIEDIAKKASANCGVALYDVEIKSTQKGKVVLVYITKLGGVSVDDCVNVSRAISSVVDTEEIFKKKYFLEVSSPGIERKLKLKKHYMGAINEYVKLNIHFEDSKQVIKGKLLEVQQEFIVVELKNNDKKQFEFKYIKKAVTCFVN